MTAKTPLESLTMRPYSRTQIVLHWLVALLVAAQFLLNESIAEAWDGFLEGRPVVFDPLILTHVLGGGLILALVAWRMVMRKRHGAVVPVAGTSVRMARVTHWGHFALYGSLVLMALSGSGAWIGEVEQAAETHSLLSNLVLALIAGHIAAALYHQFWLKDGLLRRMSLKT
jgi:cytochrome b561